MFSLFDTKYNDNDKLWLKNISLELFNDKLEFNKLSVKSIDNYIDKINILVKHTYDAIANLEQQELTFSNILTPIIELDIAISKVECLLSVGNKYDAKKDIRKASDDAQRQLKTLFRDNELREDVYKVLKKYEEGNYKKEQQFLTKEEDMFFKSTIKHCEDNMLHIQDEDKKQQIIEIKANISKLASDFKSNLSEDNSFLEMTKDELLGLPEDWLESHKIEQKDLYKVKLKAYDYLSISKNAKNRETRKKMSTAFFSRNKDKNTKIMLDIVSLRQQLMELKGYKNYVDYIAKNKIAQNSENVSNFIDKMSDNATSLLEQELQEITSFAKEYTNNKDFILETYDISYFSNLIKGNKFNIDPNEIKKYFPTNKVVQGCFNIYEKLLGLKFELIDDENKWHKDVELYYVYNYDYKDNIKGEKIGSFYLDLYSRDNKKDHACIYKLLYGCDISNFTGKKNDRMLPVVVINLNFPEKANLEIRSIKTFFHEFGHVMHNMCSKTQLSYYHGSTGAKDFTEAPSQMFERFCLNEKVLSLLSCHEETGQPIPKKLIDYLINTNDFLKGLHTKTQLAYAKYDYTIHTLPKEEIKDLNLNNLFKEIYNDFTQLPKADEMCIPATFHHLAKGYAGIYYGYMLADTIASDMYNIRFAKDPLNPDVGMEYRKCILEPGGSKEVIEILKDFLGKEYNISGFSSNDTNNKKHKVNKIE